MYAIVDIETTGGQASANSITEIAVYIHDGEKIIKRFETLVNPLQPIPSYIVALTGINDVMVKDAPCFDEVADVLFDLLDQKIFVAHNVNFDYSFIRHQLQNSGYNLSTKRLCTIRLARKVFPGLPSYSLGNLCRSLDISIQNRHRAGGDARATVQLLEQLLANGAQQHIDKMLKPTSSEQWLPLHLDKTVIEKLPLVPGVYYFHDKKDKIIYIGKAVNIKKRITSHFIQNNSNKKRQDFLRNIHKITYRPCATELEALVLESTEIKKWWPKYNDSQKQPLQKYALYQFEDARGYIRLAIDKKKKNIPALYSFNLLNEGIILLRKMIEEFDLNARFCFLDKTAFDAAGYALLDPPEVYNAKIKKALCALNKQLPSFALIDKGLAPENKFCLLVEKGCFWGMGYLPASYAVSSSDDLKNLLQPYRDNDYIRNQIYSFVQSYPDKRIQLV